METKRKLGRQRRKKLKPEGRRLGKGSHSTPKGKTSKKKGKRREKCGFSGVVSSGAKGERLRKSPCRKEPDNQGKEKKQENQNLGHGEGEYLTYLIKKKGKKKTH